MTDAYIAMGHLPGDKDVPLFTTIDTCFSATLGKAQGLKDKFNLAKITRIAHVRITEIPMGDNT